MSFIQFTCKLSLILSEISHFLATDEALQENTLSQPTRNLVRHWLETCRTGHVHCNQRVRRPRAILTLNLVQKWLSSCRKDMITCNQWYGSPTWTPISSLMQNWLETCTVEKGDVSSAWFPTRLIDLGISDEDDVKLIDTRNTAPTGPYATLSHRWADSVVIRTILSNVRAG